MIPQLFWHGTRTTGSHRALLIPTDLEVTKLDRSDRGVRTIAGTQLGQNMFDVAFHRVIGDRQAPGDLGVAQAPRQQRQDFQLARREWIVSQPGITHRKDCAGRAVLDISGREMIDRDWTVKCIPHRGSQLHRGTTFEDVSRCTGAQPRELDVRIIRERQDEHGSRRTGPPQSPDYFEAIQAGNRSSMTTRSALVAWARATTSSPLLVSPTTCSPESSATTARNPSRVRSCSSATSKRAGSNRSRRRSTTGRSATCSALAVIDSSKFGAHVSARRKESA